MTAQQAAAPDIYGRSQLMVVAAVRYCLGRSSYIVGDCCDWLCDVWPALDQSTQLIVRRDVEDKFERGAFGMDMDRRQWLRVRALWATVSTEAA